MRSIFPFLKQGDRVNGLSLPKALVQLIKEGRWVKHDWDFFRDCVDAQTASRRVVVLPSWKSRLDEWTTDPGSEKPVADVFLYSLDEMLVNTKAYVDKEAVSTSGSVNPACLILPAILIRPESLSLETKD